VKTFDIKTIVGLSEKQAQDALEKAGYNEIPSANNRSVIAIII
jgi:hypothetical protein